MTRLLVALRRLLGVVTMRPRPPARLAADDPARVLVGDDVRDARAHLVRLGSPAGSRDVAARTGHGVLTLWTAGAAVRYRLDERAEVSVEFGNGFVLMGRARLAGTSAMRVEPLRRELADLELLVVPTGTP